MSPNEARRPDHFALQTLHFLTLPLALLSDFFRARQEGSKKVGTSFTGFTERNWGPNSCTMTGTMPIEKCLDLLLSDFSFI